MPEPFNQEAPVKGMLADLNEKVAKRGMKGINSTAMSKDSLLDITRDGYFYDSMNDLHHRIPIEGRSSNYMAMTGEHWERSCRYISLAGASLGFALRFHNKNHPEDLTSLTDLIQIIAKGNREEPWKDVPQSTISSASKRCINAFIGMSLSTLPFPQI